MSVLFVIVAVAAMITSLVCLKTAHCIAATVAGLIGIGAFLLANIPAPGGIAAASSSEQSTCQPGFWYRSEDSQCR
ncbi:hypothetical protein BHQ21_15070 [Mycobacterium sherrisii]|uniref:Uncharacterized protein n=1 Tax=Mycobacterium sherrisii TaxID=243061 RepID=A0A1E3SSL7_9MYCO|nr:hypothetical protein [Mycobacterium sherrisii]ODR05089.1 hypothetical protein BHQ21_15070 [Mycobacterium sherrisii]